MRLPPHGSWPAEHTTREQQEGPQQREHPVDRNPEHSEWKQHQPHQRVEQKDSQRERPAHHEEDQPQDEGGHPSTLLDIPSQLAAAILIPGAVA